ncbi:MAG: HesA/MoeB/ThiF family protein [Alphaproteobacteria bacterium]|nr:MAG: HesA/MoeB/ThiF family protein [Alphaproteobacteria bacterium]
MALRHDQLERYARHLVLPEIGGPGQQRLLESSVLLVGAGGIGAPAALYLAAAGVGRIGLLDDDQVSLSNLQRQILYRTDEVGMAKAEAAARHLRALNPDVRAEPIITRLSAENAERLVADYDLVLDGSDNFATRLAVGDACLRTGRTLVSAALRRFEGQLAVFKPHLSPDQPCYHCLVGDSPDEGGGAPCAELGVLGAVAGVLGCWAAMETVKELVGGFDSLAGRLILFDGLGGKVREVMLPRDPACSHASAAGIVA